MARISSHEFIKLNQLEQISKTKVNAYWALKKQLVIPDKDDPSYEAFIKASEVLRKIFFEEKFNILDAVVAERGYGPATDSDTHYRGRVMESVLNGSFDGKSDPDFRYCELKLIETVGFHKLAQVLTVGAIFNAINKANGDYIVVEDYYKSNFYKKVKQALIMSYRKEGMQLGMTPDNIMPFTATEPIWADKLKEDWESVRDEMKQAITEYKAGTRKRKASGICKSDTNGTRRPNGYLGIRSDCVIITPAFFEIISKHYFLG